MHRLCSVLLGADVTLDTHPGLEPNTSSCSGTTQMLVLFIFSCTETGNLQYAEALEPRQSQGHLTSSAGVKHKVLGWRCPGVGGWRSGGTHSEGTTWCQPVTSKPWCPALAGIPSHRSHYVPPVLRSTGGNRGSNSEHRAAACFSHSHRSIAVRKDPQGHQTQPSAQPPPLPTLLLISPLLC